MAIAAALSLPAAGGAALPPRAAAERVGVLVELSGAPAARSPQNRSQRQRALARAQGDFVARLRAAVPEVEVRWRYSRVLNAIAVVVPRRATQHIRQLPGVTSVTPAVRYQASLDTSPSVIGAPTSWRPGLANLGEGIKVAIIDDGLDAKSPMFEPDDYTMPDGFPRGDVRFTSEKVIVAKVFPPASAPIPAAKLPFDRKRSQHATHVAGIAAGNAGVLAPKIAGRPRLPLSGVAPRAYLGNYRALTYPTESGVGLNGNSPEILAAIEAAVADGMDVINLSLGQPEVAPSRDLVALALDNASAMGVVAVVAAGNDFVELGGGSISSPGTSEKSITVGATTSARAYGTNASVTQTPGGPVSATLTVAAIAGSEAAALTARELALLAPEAVSADLSLCTAPTAQAPARPSTVALAAGGGCTLRLKAKNASLAGAAALLVAADDSATYRTRVKASAIPILVAPTVQVNAAADIARVASTPRLVVGSEAAPVATTDPPRLASFSAGGPTPLSHRLKPDVAAPGVSVYSAFPVRDGSFGIQSGTSMAAPHVAGGAALLKEIHPQWTPAQIKSSLVITGRDVRETSGAAFSPPSRVGGGLVDLVTAASPLLHLSPSSASFGLVRVQKATFERDRVLELADAGGGSGQWRVTHTPARVSRGTLVELPSSVEVPGTLRIELRVRATAQEGDVSGWIVLERDGITRRVPYWARITRPKLPRTASRQLTKTGTYEANNRRAAAKVDAYRYPERPSAGLLRGPELTFSVKLKNAAVNFGVAIISQRAGTAVEPRIVFGRDENALAGASALPINENPYQLGFGDRRLIAGVLRPAAGRYTVVFDSRLRRTAGPFRFRFWLNDVTPPTIRVERRQTSDGTIRARVRDRGSGVDPASLSFSIDGSVWLPAQWNRASRTMLVDLSGLRPGQYTVRFRAADRQETKNWEYATSVLPNTRIVTRQIRIVRDP